MHGFKTDLIVTYAIYPENYMFWAIGADKILKRGTHMHVPLDQTPIRCLGPRLMVDCCKKSKGPEATGRFCW